MSLLAESSKMSGPDESSLFFDSYTSPKEQQRSADESNYNQIAEEAKEKSLRFEFAKNQLQSTRNRYGWIYMASYITAPLTVFVIRKPYHCVMPFGCFVSAIYFQLKCGDAEMKMFRSWRNIEDWDNVSRRADRLLFDIRYRNTIDADLQKKRIDDKWKAASEYELPKQTKEMNDFVLRKTREWQGKRQV